MYAFIRKFYNRLVHYKRSKYIEALVQKGLVLGENVQFVENYFLDPSHCYLISIGSNTTICPNVRFIAHDASIKKHLGYTKMGKITVGKNCFIGDSTILLPGVIVGDNSIIGSGSVLTKDIPEGHVAAGNPAKVICTTKAYIEKIQAIADTKRVFGKDYYLEHLTSSKIKEMEDSIGDSIGFIV